MWDGEGRGGGWSGGEVVETSCSNCGQEIEKGCSTEVDEVVRDLVELGVDGVQ